MAAASTARTSRTPRSAARSRCAPAAARSRPRTSSTSPARSAPELARVRAVAAGDGADAGSVRVLVVPAAAGRRRPAAVRAARPVRGHARRRSPTASTRRGSSARGSIVEPPVYRGITVVARLRPRPRGQRRRASRRRRSQALYDYFHPITGGPDGTGWPFGRPVQVGEVYSVLQRLRGTELVEDVRLFGADPITGQRGQATQRLDLEPHALVFSYEHQVLVEGARPCAERCPGWRARTRSASSCPPSTRTTTSPSGSRRRSTRSWPRDPGPRLLPGLPRPGAGAGGLPRLARGLGRRAARRDVADRAAAGVRRVRAASCSGCGAPRPGSRPTSRSSPAARSRSSSPGRRAGRTSRGGGPGRSVARPLRPRPRQGPEGGVPAARLEALIAASKPAHLPHRLEIVKPRESARRDGRSRRAGGSALRCAPRDAPGRRRGRQGSPRGAPRDRLHEVRLSERTVGQLLRLVRQLPRVDRARRSTSPRRPSRSSRLRNRRPRPRRRG